MSFEQSYLGQLRKHVGARCLKSPGSRIILLNEQNEILLELRKDMNVWGLIGGAADENEDIVTTAKRELEEETNLKALNIQHFAFMSDPRNGAVMTYPHGDVVHVYDMCFVVTKWEGQIKLSDESIDLRFWPMSDLPKNLKDDLEITLDIYKKYKETGQFQLF